MLLTILYIIGITAEAMTGALSAARNRMDLFGVIMIAEVTAIGGGSIRDFLFGNYPLVWVKNPEYLLIIAVAAVISVQVSGFMHYFRTLFLVLDAIGLSVFTVLGANVALTMDLPTTTLGTYFLAIVAATITGTFGGIARDIMCNRIPLVFRKELYAGTIPIPVIIYCTFHHFGWNRDAAVIICLLGVCITRLLAIKFEWSLPTFEYQEREYRRNPNNRIWNIDLGTRFSRLRSSSLNPRNLFNKNGKENNGNNDTQREPK